MVYNQNYGSRSGGSGNMQDMSSTPKAVEIKSFYQPGTDTINPKLFDETAQEVANSLVGKNKYGKDIGVSSTQLRRIYDEVKRFEQILSLADNKWEEQLPYIKMVRSKVAYAVARAGKQKPEEKGVYKNLEKFISSGIDLIHNEKDYHVFASLFEAAYGFYYEKAPKSN